MREDRLLSDRLASADFTGLGTGAAMPSLHPFFSFFYFVARGEQQCLFHQGESTSGPALPSLIVDSQRPRHGLETWHLVLHLQVPGGLPLGDIMGSLCCDKGHTGGSKRSSQGRRFSWR